MRVAEQIRKLIPVENRKQATFSDAELDQLRPGNPEKWGLEQFAASPSSCFLGNVGQIRPFLGAFECMKSILDQ